MRKSNYTLSFRFCILLLLSIMLISVSLTACGESAKPDNNAETQASETESTETGEVRDTRFDNVDFTGRDFRIFTSININDATNANILIEGTGEINGDVVNDAVYTRNQTAEDLLGVKLIFTESDYDYGAVTANIRKLILSADDAYELIINDLFPAAELTYEGMFVNVNNAENFDFTKSY